MSVNLGFLEAFLGLNTTGITTGLARAQRQMAMASKRMTSIGKTMSRSITLPLVLIGGASIKLAVDFEKSMSKIEGLVGIASDKVNAFSKDILKLAGPTAQAPEKLAEAMFFITSAGLRGADAMDVLTMSARAASANVGDVSTVADLVTSATNAYGISALSAAQATDTLVATIREGKRPPEEIAASIGRVLPVASEMGITFQDVGAAIAAMSRTGTNAAEAVTGLRQILFSILKPAEQSEKAFEAMGTSGQELREMLGKEDGLINLLGFLRENTTKSKNAFSEAFPNVRALAAALDVMGKNAEENKRIFARMKDNTGDLDKAFGAAAKTVDFKLKRAFAELKVEVIKIGQILIPIFLKIIEAVRKGIKWFNQLSTGTKQMGIAFAGLLAVAGPVLMVLGAIGTAIAGISLPVVAVVVAIAALSAAILYIADNWDAIIERISDWGWWKNMLINMAQFLLRWSPASLMIKSFNFLVKSVTPLWNKLIAKISDITWWKQMLVNLIKFFLKYNPFSLMWKGIQKIMGVDWGGLFDGIKEGLDKVKIDPKKYIIDPIPNIFEAMADGLEGLKSSTKEYEHQFGSMLDTIKNAANKAKNALVGLLSGGGGGGGATATTGGGAVPVEAIKAGGITGQESIDAMATSLKTLGARQRDVANGWDQQVENMNRVLIAGEALGTAMQNVLNSAFIELGETLGNLFSGDAGAGSFFKGILGVLASFMKTLGQAAIAAGVAGIAFKSLFSNPFALVAAGVALIIAATVLTNVMKKGPKTQGLRSGGFVTEGGVFQLHADELVNLPKGSAVTPANMVGSAGGRGTQTIVIKGELDGRTIRWILDEEDRITGNTFGG